MNMRIPDLGKWIQKKAQSDLPDDYQICISTEDQGSEEITITLGELRKIDWTFNDRSTS